VEGGGWRVEIYYSFVCSFLPSRYMDYAQIWH
jgi:hypothetical protein